MPRLMLIALLLLAGCGEPGNGAASSAAGEVISSDNGLVQLTGKQAYDQACAGCHEEGIDGAPKTGDRDAWAGRSWLWEAVLFEHAKDGYLTMPARGGEESLDDATVEMAAEYMLTLTFPDAPPAD